MTGVIGVTAIVTVVAAAGCDSPPPTPVRFTFPGSDPEGSADIQTRTYVPPPTFNVFATTPEPLGARLPTVSTEIR